MTPFVRPLAALFQQFTDGLPEPVAIIAVDGEDYLAVDQNGASVQGIHGQFEILDHEVVGAVYQARYADGS